MIAGQVNGTCSVLRHDSKNNLPYRVYRSFGMKYGDILRIFGYMRNDLNVLIFTREIFIYLKTGVPLNFLPVTVTVITVTTTAPVKFN